MTPDYQAALESAALFDVSSTGKVLVTGPDAAAFLHNIASNDIKGLPVGGGCETYFLDHRAKVLHQAWVYRVMHNGETAYWLDTTPDRGDALFKHLDKFLISEQVELQDVTSQYTMLHLAGPTAQTLLELPDLEEFQHVDRDGLSIRRHDPLGVPGFDIVGEKDQIEELRKKLWMVPSGTADTYETLRIEAGTPVYGQDFDDTRFVLELPRAARGISYTKGCFPGQEPIVMSRDRAGHVNRYFVGLQAHAKQGAGRIPGYKILNDQGEVGIVTSQTVSPRRGQAVALGYVRRGCHELGTELHDDGGCHMVVLGHPPKLDHPLS